MKVYAIQDKQGEAYVFHCPGCDMNHIIPISYAPEFATRNGKSKPTWRFNGDCQKPTFFPDFKIEWTGAEPPQCCHCIIREGEIIYLVETTHRFSGTRMKMVDAQ